MRVARIRVCSNVVGTPPDPVRSETVTVNAWAVGITNEPVTAHTIGFPPATDVDVEFDASLPEPAAISTRMY